MALPDLPKDSCMMLKTVNRKYVPYLAYEGSWLFQYTLDKLTMNHFLRK